MKAQHIGVVANCGKPHAPAALKRLSDKAKTLGLSVVCTEDTATLLPGARQVETDELASEVDVLLALGGDGTMLRAVRLLAGRDTPVMGVNLGSLGFMTSVPEQDLEQALEVLAAGTFHVSHRTLAECDAYHGEQLAGSYRALNDVVVGWGSSSRVLTLDLALDGEPVTTYMCDGLIVSTPTGSTGHSLSAGGPILHPETPAFAISVICPHALSHRPLIVPDRSAITVQVANTSSELLLSIDGQEQTRVSTGDRLEIRRSEQGVRFVHCPEYSYFSLLRQKLGWRGSSV